MVATTEEDAAARTDDRDQGDQDRSDSSLSKHCGTAEEASAGCAGAIISATAATIQTPGTRSLANRRLHDCWVRVVSVIQPSGSPPKPSSLTVR